MASIAVSRCRTHLVAVVVAALLAVQNVAAAARHRVEVRRVQHDPLLELLGWRDAVLRQCYGRLCCGNAALRERASKSTGQSPRRVPPLLPPLATRLGIRRVGVEHPEGTVRVEAKHEDEPQRDDNMHNDSVARSKPRREEHHEADPELQQSRQRVCNMLDPVHTGEERSMQRGIIPEDDGEHERDA